MLLYAHRGYKKKENTIESFKNSFNIFDGFELDVRLSKDKIPVVIHDSNLLRTHDSDTIVHLTNYEDLKKYNILTLLETLLLVKNNNKKCLIDIKVKNNSNYIINYLKKLIDSKKISSSIFKCIVYTDNINFYPNIQILRAGRYKFTKNINTKFHGISIAYRGSDKEIEYIQNNIDYILKKNFHLNLYIESSNSNSDNFIKYLILNYNNISITL